MFITRAQYLRAQHGRHPVRVFTFDGKPIKQVSTRAWHRALARARIQNFRWHDLRHTWASWHVRNGTPLFALQELAGWETEKMVRRYAHFAVSHLAVYADNVEFEGARALAIGYEALGPGQVAAVTTPTFTPPEVRNMRTYELMATPLVYPGQVVRARLVASGTNRGNVAARLRLPLDDRHC